MPHCRSRYRSTFTCLPVPMSMPMSMTVAMIVALVSMQLMSIRWRIDRYSRRLQHLIFPKSYPRSLFLLLHLHLSPFNLHLSPIHTICIQSSRSFLDPLSILSGGRSGQDPPDLWGRLCSPLSYSTINPQVNSFDSPPLSSSTETQVILTAAST